MCRYHYPPPKAEELSGKCSDAWEAVYGSVLVRMVLDCTEYRIQAPSNKKAARTVWSDYKQGHTPKILAAIAPSGAFVWASDAFPGRVSDIEICECSGFMDLVEEGDCYPADKGFDGLAASLREKLARVVAPPRKFRGVAQFTSDEREQGALQSNLRIHVERHFSRVQAWGVFSRKKISLLYADLIGNMFFVVSHLCNFSTPLHADSCFGKEMGDDEEAT